MLNRRYRWGAALLLAGLLPGCATGGSNWSLFDGLSARSSQRATVDDSAIRDRYSALAAEFPEHFGAGSGASPSAPSAVSSPSTESSGPWSTVTTTVKQAASKTAEALSFKPRVTPAQDPISLAHDSGPLGEEVYMQVARLHEKQGDLARAREQYKKAMEIKPQDLTIMLSYARVCHASGDFDEAVATYQRAIQSHPHNSLAVNDLALCLAHHNRINESLVMLERAIQMDPQNERYRNNMATVLVQRGEPQKALEHLKAVYPEAVAHYNIGFLLHQRERHSEAVSYLVRATELDPALAQAHALLARIPLPQATLTRRSAAAQPGPVGQPPLPQQYTTAVAQQPGLAARQAIPVKRTPPTAPVSHQQPVQPQYDYYHPAGQ